MRTCSIRLACLLLLQWPILALAQFNNLEADDTAGFRPFLSLSGSYSYSSNINAQRGSDGSGIFRFGPSFGMSRNRGLFGTTFRGSLSAVQYVDRDEISNINGNASVAVSGPNRDRYPLRMNWDAGYSRSTSTDPDVGDVRTSSSYRSSLGGSYRFDSRYSMNASVRGNYNQSNSGGFSDSYGIGTSLSGGYNYSENLSFNFGGNYSYSESSGSVGQGVQSDTYSVSLGANGRLLPKVTGSLGIGAAYNVSNGRNANERFSPSADIGLNWQAATRTTVGLSGSSGFSLTANDQTSRNSSVSVRVSQGITSRLGGSVNASYSNSEIFGTRNRTDDRFGLGAGLNYSVNRDIRVGVNGSVNLQQSSRSANTFGSYSTSANISWNL